VKAGTKKQQETNHPGEVQGRRPLGHMGPREEGQSQPGQRGERRSGSKQHATQSSILGKPTKTTNKKVRDMNWYTKPGTSSLQVSTFLQEKINHQNPLSLSKDLPTVTCLSRIKTACLHTTFPF
jgi:hypothetical protein